MQILLAALCIIAKAWSETVKCPPIGKWIKKTCHSQGKGYYPIRKMERVQKLGAKNYDAI